MHRHYCSPRGSLPMGPNNTPPVSAEAQQSFSLVECEWRSVSPPCIRYLPHTSYLHPEFALARGQFVVRVSLFAVIMIYNVVFCYSSLPVVDSILNCIAIVCAAQDLRISGSQSSAHQDVYR